MKSQQVVVPSGEIEDLVIKDSGAYGSTIMLYNSGTVDLELGGADLDDTNGWRGFKAGSVVAADISPDEACRVRNPSDDTDGSVDVLVVK